MNDALSLRRVAVVSDGVGEAFSRLAMALPVDPSGHTSADATAWPVLWARCWVRVRSWRTPPRWTAGDWCDEARAQAALAYSQARRDFDPFRGVPFDAFLYGRVVNAVWTRHRQECNYGRHTRHGAIPDRSDPAARPGPDPDTLVCLEAAIARLAGFDRDLILALFWNGRSENDLAQESGISRQAVNLRKRKILIELRRQLGTP